jgi:DNA-binding GntR family transcriptional regulator
VSQLAAIPLPLEEYAYRSLRDMIVRGDLPPRAQIVQEEVAERLGISRTPLRRALVKLAAQHFIDLSPGQGAFVKAFEPEELASIFEIRAVLEGLVCRCATERVEAKHIAYLRSLINDAARSVTDTDWSTYRQADIEFHTYLVDVAADTHLKSVVESVQVFSLSLAQGLLRPPAETLPEHLEILDALDGRDPDAAERLMVRHIRRTIADIRARAPLQRAARPVIDELAATVLRRVALVVRYRDHAVVIAQDRHHRPLLEPPALQRSAAHDVLFSDAPGSARARAHTLAAPVVHDGHVAAALVLVGEASDAALIAGLATTLERHAVRIGERLAGVRT